MTEPAPPLALSAPYLLVVDDDADMLRLLTMRLTAAGYRVTAVTSTPFRFSRTTQSHVISAQRVAAVSFSGSAV